MASNFSLMRALVGLSREFRYLNAVAASWTLSADELDLPKIVYFTSTSLFVRLREKPFNILGMQEQVAPLSQFKKLIGMCT